MSWRLVKEVAWREIWTRSRTKAYRIITGILIAAAVIGPILAAVWPDGGDELRQVTISLVGVDDATQQQILAFSEDSLDVTFQDLSDLSPDQVDQALTDGNIDVALEPGPTLVWDSETDFEIAGVLFAVLQQQGVFIKGRDLALGDDDIAELLALIQLQERFVDEPNELATTVAFFGLMVVFILPQVFSQLAMLSVVEEKSTRVIEVLLSHLRPRTLLLGKVLGLSALAVVQLVVVVGGLTAALLLTNAVEIPASVWRFVPIIVVSILGGLAIYNTFFALWGRSSPARKMRRKSSCPSSSRFLLASSSGKQW